MCVCVSKKLQMFIGCWWGVWVCAGGALLRVHLSCYYITLSFSRFGSLNYINFVNFSLAAGAVHYRWSYQATSHITGLNLGGSVRVCVCACGERGREGWGVCTISAYLLNSPSLSLSPFPHHLTPPHPRLQLSLILNPFNMAHKHYNVHILQV